MTLLKAGAVLSRDLSIPGIDGLVTADITSSGLTLRAKGSRKKIHLNWSQVITAGRTEQNVPSFLMDKPLELIQYESAKVNKRR